MLQDGMTYPTVSSDNYQITNGQVKFINDYVPPNGSTIMSINYSRPASGKRVSTISYARNGSGKRVSSIDYSRNASGKRISSIDYSKNASGKRISTIEYVSGGETVNTIEYSSASLGPYALEQGGSTYTAANNDRANVDIVINDTLQPKTSYTITNGQIEFTAGNEKSANDTVTSIKHSRSNVAFEPTGELTVEIDGELQDPDTYVIFGENNDQIRFDTAPANGATTTLFLHSEDEANYTFGIRATDPQNTESSDREFSIFVNRPGIAWITPTTVLVPFTRTAGIVSNQTVNLAAATYNKDSGTYENVTLSLTDINLAGSGLTLMDGTTFSYTTGVVGRMLTGQPTSFENDTNFNITLRAQEDEPSYNSERTLTITILQDPNYASPS
jgi:hypothetical protein